MTVTVYTFPDIATRFVRKAATYTHRRYRHYGVEADDVTQELYVWLYGPGEVKVRRWLAADPQQTTRIYRSLLDKALAYAEREKASRVGYETDDVHWYSPTLVEGLIPLALDSTFDGKPPLEGESSGRRTASASEGGDYLAMVADVRRALDRCGEWVRLTFLNCEPGAGGWDEAVRVVVNFLGGESPYRERRRAVSNDRALAITRGQE